MPVLTQMARSTNPSLAAEAADEVAAKSKELAKLKRASADLAAFAAAVPATNPTEGRSGEAALAA